MPLDLNCSDREELERQCRSQSLRAGDVRKARLLLLLAEGRPYSEIEVLLGCSSAYISRWKKRYESQGMAGLRGRQKGREATVLTPALQARILAKTSQKPSDGSTHWSTRKLAKELGVRHQIIAKAWSRAGIKPHRMERYMASDDPEFETKAADVIGLYLNPPQHAAVFCVDEKTAIQALDRLDPVLPLSPGRFERHGFEYFRHGTLSLYAALDTQTGSVLGRTADSHTSEEFVSFLGDLLASQPEGKEIHVILDNLSAHKSKRVKEFLSLHPQVHFHFTPTYSSWLNQVELWFSKIERDVIARGVFTSVKDLARKLLRYIRLYNREAKPIKWKYSDPSRRIQDASNPSGTGH